MINNQNSFIASYEEAKSLNFNPLNRVVDQKRVKKFLKEITTRKDFMLNNNLSVYQTNAILVNFDNMNVIDGQHRLTAYLEAVEKGIIPATVGITIGKWKCFLAEEDEIKSLNLIAKIWGENDNAGQEILKGNENFLKLAQFAKNHSLCRNEDVDDGDLEYDEDTNWPILVPLKLRYAAAIIKGKPQHKQITDGTFTVTDEELRNAETIHSEISSLLKAIWGREKVDQSIEQLISTWCKNRNTITLKKACSNLKKKKNAESIKNGSAEIRKNTLASCFNPNM